MRFLVAILLAGLPFLLQAQTVLFSEDFNSYPNGTQNDTGRWTSTFADMDDNTINMGDNYWGVFNGRFRVNDIEGPLENCENFIEFNTFGINGFCDVKITLDVDKSSKTFNCGTGLAGDDWFTIQYRIDGGPWDTCDVNGYICGDFTPPITVRDSCNEGSNMAIRIQVGNKANDETYFFDNLTVTGFNYTDFVNAGPDLPACLPGAVQLNATGNNLCQDYTWIAGSNISDPNIPNPVATPTASSTYIVRSRINSCEAFDTVNVTATSGTLPPIFPPNYTEFACLGDTFRIQAQAGFDSYLWNFNGVTTSFLDVTTTAGYNVTYTQGNQCGRDTAVIVFEAAVSVNLGADTAICGGGSLSLNASSPSATSYNWSTGASGPQIIANTAGNYAVTVSNNCNTVVDDINVTFGGPLPSPFLPDDQTICDGDQYTISSLAVGTYLWSDGSTEPTLTVSDSGIYSVTVTSSCDGSTVSDDIRISVDSCVDTSLIPPVIPAAPCYILMPTAFSPNRDGYNDRFVPITACDTTSWTMMIWDRWGTLIYQTSSFLQADPYVGWDGMQRGVQARLGTYVYAISYFNGIEFVTDYGNVTLIR